MVTRLLRFVLPLSTCRTTDISRLASFAHPRKLIHENFCLNIISLKKVALPYVTGPAKINLVVA